MGISWDDIHRIPIRILSVLVSINRELRKEALREARRAAGKKKGPLAVVEFGQFVL